MKKLIAAALVAALAGGAAEATVTATMVSGGYAASAANPNLITFDGSNPLNGFTLSGSGYSYNNGTTPSGDTSANFLGVSGGSANFTNGTAYTNVQFYWGTPDNYNFIDLYSGSTLIGTVSTSTFTMSGDSLVSITSTQAFDNVSFRSTSCCFEIDNISFQGAGAVPEPASWAMMILGFGAIGYAMRHRPKATVTQTLR